MSAALFWAFMQAFGLSNVWWGVFALASVSIQWASNQQDLRSGQRE